MNIRPIVKYHGGKGRLFKWILEHLPNHKIYCEPFGGAASVLVNKNRSDKEVYNDIEHTIVNLMRVARDNPDGLIEALRGIQYCEQEYKFYRELYLSEEKYQKLSDLDKAVAAYVTRRMSRSGTCGTFCWSNRTYSTGPAEVHCWNSSLQNLEWLSARLQGVEILNENALDVIERYDSEDTLFYLDPPYLHSTRFSTNMYWHESSEEDHIKLAELCREIKGSVVLSGYPSELYEKLYSGWTAIIKETANHSSQKPTKETMQECLWIKKA